MSVSDDFAQAQIDVKGLPSKPSNDVLLRLYSLYKQGTEGDATGSRPRALDFVGRAKYDAWKGLTGAAMEDAQKEYVALVAKLRATS